MTTPPDLPPNSHASREDKPPVKKVERVTTGKIVKREPTLMRKISNTFTGDDARSVGNYILFDIALPALKAMISDAVSQGAERMLFGESRRRTTSGRSGSYVNYSDRDRSRGAGSAGYNPNERRPVDRSVRAGHNFDEIIMETRAEADLVLDRMVDLLEKYDFVSVTDFYDLVGARGEYVDDKWGWTDLTGAGIDRVARGYIVRLPRTSALK